MNEATMIIEGTLFVKKTSYIPFLIFVTYIYMIVPNTTEMEIPDYLHQDRHFSIG